METQAPNAKTLSNAEILEEKALSVNIEKLKQITADWPYDPEICKQLKCGSPTVRILLNNILSHPLQRSPFDSRRMTVIKTIDTGSNNVLTSHVLRIMYFVLWSKNIYDNNNLVYFTGFNEFCGRQLMPDDKIRVISTKYWLSYIDNQYRSEFYPMFKLNNSKSFTTTFR